MEVFDTSSSRRSAPLSCRVRIPMGAPVGPSRIRRSQRGEPHQGECGLTKNPRPLRPSGLEALGLERLEPMSFNRDQGFLRFDVAQSLPPRFPSRNIKWMAMAIRFLDRWGHGPAGGSISYITPLKIYLVKKLRGRARLI